jgi:hypothetical protein
MTTSKLPIRAFRPVLALAGALLAALTLAFAAAAGAQPPPHADDAFAHGRHGHGGHGAHGHHGPSAARHQPQPVDLSQAPVHRWIAAEGGSWQDATHWSTGEVPGSDDHAILDLPGTYTVTLEGDATVAGLTLTASSSDGGPTLHLARHSLVIRGLGRVGAGAALHLDGGIVTGDGDLEVEGTLRWTGGTLSGAGGVRIAPLGHLEITGEARKYLALRRLENRGRAVWRGEGPLVLTFESVFANRDGGQLDLESDAFFDVYGPAGPRFENDGLLRKLASGTSTFETSFTNRGTVEVHGGTLLLLEGYQQTAGRTHLFEGELSSPKTVSIEGGAFRWDGSPESPVRLSARQP